MSKPMKSFYDFFCHFGATMIFYVNVCTFFCNINDNSGYNNDYGGGGDDNNDDDDGATELQCENKIIKLLAHSHTHTTTA